VIGKVYHIDRADIFQAMDGMRQAGFGPQDEFSIPQPLAYVPSLRLLLQEKLEGTPADEILKKGDEKSSASAVERCAQWLARFHVLAPRTGPVSYPSDYLSSKSIRRCSRKIAKRGGSSAGKAAVLLQRLEDAVASLHPEELCAGHGSYSATHVILLRQRTLVFDWDGYDVADPARDVARFLAALRRLALGRLGSIRALDRVADVFLKTYLAVGQPLAEENLRFFEAAACLKLAKYNLCHPVPHWHDKTEAMLDEGLRILDREAA
jgi:aminoglycoside phosphotransferase (APT) family kinase protein